MVMSIPFAPFRRGFFVSFLLSNFPCLCQAVFCFFCFFLFPPFACFLSIKLPPLVSSGFLDFPKISFCFPPLLASTFCFPPFYQTSPACVKHFLGIAKKFFSWPRQGVRRELETSLNFSSNCCVLPRPRGFDWPRVGARGGVRPRLKDR